MRLLTPVALLLAAALSGAPAFADEPNAQAIDTAKKILISVGLKASMDQIVPAMLSQLEGQLGQLHPEQRKPLHDTLVSLLPEFNKGEDAVFEDTAKVLAGRLSAEELAQTLTYFDSPAGKKYTQAQAPVLEMLASSGGLWRQKLTKIIVERTREEMKKKGFDF